ncbi:hypothetical protein ACFODZ_14640 [Marinicella sediminis]|uniref:DUF4105 domain-containing protein n=1 Tax=Marinicella sediminis TaxID=1792834 RepID=A0ABV7JBZ2_9GAMM|nr:hypothetical protein [Marinicella sediminis]
MNYRLVLYWLLSMLALLLCLWFPTEQKIPRDLPPIDLVKSFEVEPSYLYFLDNQFHAVAGNRLEIGLKKKYLKNKFQRYNTLVINDLNISLNKVISLNWTLNKQRHKVPLNLTRTSVNRIDFNTRKAKDIKNLHLLIEHNPEMGIHKDPLDEVTFSSMYLSNGHPSGQPAVDFSEWLDYSPVKFNSINGYTSPDNTHLKKLILKVGTWLLISVVLYVLLGVNGQQLIGTLLIGWLLVSIPYWYNFHRQQNQLQEAFPENSSYLNALDRQAMDTARSITSKLESLPAFDPKQHKLVIFGPNQFIYLRLFYHLSEYDVAVHNTLRDLSQTSAKAIYVFFAGSGKLCHPAMAHQWTYMTSDQLSNQSFDRIGTPPVKVVTMEADYCMVMTR